MCLKVIVCVKCLLFYVIILCVVGDVLKDFCRNMGKHKEGGVSANWDSNDVMIFCDLCLKEIELGNRPTTHFSRDGWNNLTTNFFARTGKAYDRTQMKNKWDQLKKDWKLWRDLKGRETGLGWDPIRKTIAASEDWWKERLKVLFFKGLFF